MIAHWTAKDYKLTSFLEGDLTSARSESRRQVDRRLLNILSGLKPSKSQFSALGVSINAGRGKLSDSADDIDRKCSKLATILRASNNTSLEHAASELESAVSTITNSRFIATLDQTRPENLKTSMDHIRSTLEELAKTPDDGAASAAAELKTSLHQYELYYSELASALIAYKDLYENKIRPQIEEALNFSTQAVGSFDHDFHELQAQAMGVLDVAKAASGAVAVLILLSGCFVAWLAARSILGPIERMTAAMAKLAKGHHDVVVPHCGNSDEIGAMARAVEVFKRQAIEKVRMLTIQNENHEIQNKYNEIRERTKSDTIMTYHAMFFGTVLRKLLVLTDSEFGFAGEVVYEDGKSYLKIVATDFMNANFGDEMRTVHERFLREGLEVHNLDSLLGETLKTRRLVIANDPVNHPAYGGDLYPKGHPPLRSYIGIPAMAGHQMAAVVGLANAPGGYSEETAEAVQPIVNTLLAIIESLRADAARATVEQRFAMLREGTATIAFRASNDPDKMIKTISPEIASVTGYAPDDFIDNKVRSFASIIHPDDQQLAAAAIARQLPEKGKYEVEYRIACADGSIKWLREHGGRSCNGSSYEVIQGFMQDITERKRYEEEISLHRNNLQQMVDEQTKSMMEQKNKAEEATRAKSEFLANMSHELRTPMHAILSYSEMGIESLGVEDPEDINKYFHHIQSSGNRLLALLNDLLDLSKLEAGKMQYKWKHVDLRELIDNSLVELEPLINQKSLVIDVATAARYTDAVLDEQRLTQVLVNIMSNAIKFSTKGKHIEISLTDDWLANGDQAVRCCIADEGPGIPEFGTRCRVRKIHAGQQNQERRGRDGARPCNLQRNRQGAWRQDLG